MSRLYTLQFFVADRDNRIIRMPNWPQPTAEPDTIPTPSFNYYHAAQKIEQIAQRTKRFVTEPPTDEAHNPSEAIRILFVEQEHLCNRFFYDRFGDFSAHGKYFEPETIEKSSAVPSQDTKNPQGEVSKQACPIITLGLLDVMSIYEESPNLDFETTSGAEDWRENRKKNAWLYDLGLDHRVKFLDSSIWHRYVPYEKHSKYDTYFRLQFKRILCKIIHYYDLRLYNSLASLATLEFQCRMLQNASIAQYGTHGHHESVTPFKFHSETVMEHKAKQFIRFWRKETHGKGVPELSWNVLLVDDHADQPISTTDKSGKLSKKEIIEACLALSSSQGEGQTRLNIQISSHTKDTTRVISEALDHLREKTYEIILLDYLLGDSELPTQKRLKAYGHEFLLELSNVNRNNDLKRGPGGRFWVFPISSFPFAFTDKLRQLNMDGSTEQWHIAQGGDPITTPEFFRFNFYRLLLKQINEYYLHEAALERWVERFNTIQEKNPWCNAVQRQINLEKTKWVVLHNSRKTSDFSQTLTKLIEAEKNICPFWENLSEWAILLNSYQKGQQHRDLIDRLQELGKGQKRYDRLIQKISTQIGPFVADAEAHLVDYAADLKKKGGVKLSFTEMRSQRQLGTDVSLFHFPEEIVTLLPNLKELDLSGSSISKLPPEIKAFKSLETLILSSNNDHFHLPIKELRELSLYTLDLTNTKFKVFYDDPGAVKEWLQNQTTNSGKMSAPSKTGTPKKIFIIYSSIDHEYREALSKHSKILEREGKIEEIWHDRKVLPGELWDERILTELRKADIVLILVSSDAIASDYVYEKEIPLAMERFKKGEAKVIPIYIRPTDIGNAPFSEILGLPYGPDRPISKSDRDTAWVDTIIGLRTIIDQWS